MPTKPTVKLRLSPEMAGAETRVTNPVDVPAAPDTSSYDFESHSTPVETDLHSSSGMGESLPSSYEDTTVVESMPSQAARYEDTAKMPSNTGKLASKVQTAKNAPARPARTIAQDVADVKLPEARARGPLPGQGAMADKPVAKVIDRRGAKVARAKSAPPAAPEKVMTSEGSIEKVGSKAATSTAKAESVVQNYPARLRLAGDTGAIKNFGQTTKAIASKAPAAIEEKGASLASKAAPMVKRVAQAAGRFAGKVGTGLKAEVTGMDPTKPYRELQAGRAAAKVAGEAAPGLLRGFASDAGAMVRGASRGIKGAAEGLVLQSEGTSIYNTITDVRNVYDATSLQSNQNANVKQGAKYGYKVTNDTPWQAVGKSIAERFGIETDLSPKVEEDPALKAKFTAANKKRIQKMQGK